MPEKNYRVQQLPPTLGVKDPEVRMYLDALTNAWEHRSGNTDSSSPDRFITAEEFSALANDALLKSLSNAVPGLPKAPPGGQTTVADIISSLSDEIKRTILYQILGTEFPEINLSALQSKIDDVFSRASTLFGKANALIVREEEIRQTQYEAVTETLVLQASRIGSAESAILTEATTRATADTAMTSAISAQASRIDSSEAAILSETTTRTNRDNALASAINNIWSSMGGSSAVIEDGALAAVSPSAAQATKWDQVQVAVTDPNTGQISSTSIREELNSYSNAADGTLNSIYSVRAQTTQNGRTVVGGFGLAATSGAGSSGGPTIDFGVRADRFWVGSLSGVGDIPFVVNTAPTTVNGVTRPAGTYIKDAFIANGVIDNAKIGVAAIDTLKVAGGSVTTMTFGSGGGGSVAAGGSAIACSAAISMPAGASGVVITATVAVISPTSEATAYIEIVGSNGFSRLLGISLFNGFYNSATISGFDPSPTVGTTTYSVRVTSPTSGPGANKPLEFAQPSITVNGGKR